MSSDKGRYAGSEGWGGCGELTFAFAGGTHCGEIVREVREKCWEWMEGSSLLSRPRSSCVRKVLDMRLIPELLRGQ